VQAARRRALDRPRAVRGVSRRGGAGRRLQLSPGHGRGDGRGPVAPPRRGRRGVHGIEGGRDAHLQRLVAAVDQAVPARDGREERGRRDGQRRSRRRGGRGDALGLRAAESEAPRHVARVRTPPGQDAVPREAAREDESDHPGGSDRARRVFRTRDQPGGRGALRARRGAGRTGGADPARRRPVDGGRVRPRPLRGAHHRRAAARVVAVLRGAVPAVARDRRGVGARPGHHRDHQSGEGARAGVERQNRWASTSYPKEYPLVVARGAGAVVEDVDGNRYLDFMAGIAVASTGYGHPQVVRAVQEAAGRFFHICGSDFYYESFAALCERLAALAPGPSKKRVFLTNSGTEAVEGAIKLARHSTGRPALIAFTGAFHGRTMGGLSLTASKAVQRAGFAPFLPEVYHVPYGYRYRCDFCRGEPACTMRCVSSIEDDLFAKRLDPRDVAAIFVEPIQGEGGYVVPPPGYLKALRELCDRYGILLVCDEVQ